MACLSSSSFQGHSLGIFSLVLLFTLFLARLGTASPVGSGSPDAEENFPPDLATEVDLSPNLEPFDVAPDVSLDRVLKPPSEELEETLESNLFLAGSLDDSDDEPSLNVSLPLPPSISILPHFLNKPDFKQQLNDTLGSYLPDVLHKYGVPDDQIASLTANGLPLLSDLSQLLFEDENEGTSNDLEKRGWLRDTLGKVGDGLEKLGEWAGEIGSKAGAAVGCGVVAASFQPAYLSAAGTFALKNPSPGKTLTRDQEFFIHPLHFSLPDKSNTEIFYHAKWVAKNFWKSAGVTIGRRIYIRDRARTTYDAAVPADDDRNEAFWRQTKILAHEFVHTAQYRRLKYRKLAFSRRYLFHWCKAGFDEKKNKMERVAYEEQERINPLIADYRGRQFFYKWRGRGLHETLGFPIQLSYRNVTKGTLSEGEPWITSLAFRREGCRFIIGAGIAIAIGRGRPAAGGVSWCVICGASCVVIFWEESRMVSG